MFFCCCAGVKDDANAKTIGKIDTYATAEGSGADELEAFPGEQDLSPASDPTLARPQRSKTLVEPSLGRICEDEDQDDDEKSQGRGAGGSFLLTLRKGSNEEDPSWPFGVSLFYSDVVDHLEIVDVDAANESVKAYNAEAQAKSRIQAGQLILAVNGETDSVAMMLSTWRASDEVICVACWPKEFRISVSRGSGGMGVDVTHSKKGTSLLIEKLHDGPIERWNQQNPEKRVVVADRIVAINGVRGSPTELKDALKGAAGKIDMVIARRP